MEIKELEVIISVIRACERNIEIYNSFRGKELKIVPNDSKQNPIYISGKRASDILDLLTKEQEEFMKPQKEKISNIEDK